MRVNNPLFESTLVGKAAKYCMQSNQQGAIFTNYLLYVCDLKSLNDLTVPLHELHSFGKFIKSKLQNYFQNIVLKF